MKTIVTARNLTKKFGELTAVDGISFDIREGECFGFLGPNGAGKTTTVRMIHCVSPVTSGTLTVDGLPAHVDNREIKKITGLIPQEITLDVDLTVFENLIIFAKFFDIPRAEAKRRIAELLKFTELEAKRDSRINALSTGMKRRLLIARALLNRPRLIVADEPTAHLDTRLAREFMETIARLKDGRKTILIASHDPAVYESPVVDRVVLLRDGGLEGATG